MSRVLFYYTEEFWSDRLAAYVRALEKQPPDIPTEAEAAWKVGISAAMKQAATASKSVVRPMTAHGIDPKGTRLDY